MSIPLGATLWCVPEINPSGELYGNRYAGRGPDREREAMTGRDESGADELPYPNWRPYCLRCRTVERMQRVAVLHWRCRHCGAEHKHPVRIVRDSFDTIRKELNIPRKL